MRRGGSGAHGTVPAALVGAECAVAGPARVGRLCWRSLMVSSASARASHRRGVIADASADARRGRRGDDRVLPALRTRCERFRGTATAISRRAVVGSNIASALLSRRRRSRGPVCRRVLWRQPEYFSGDGIRCCAGALHERATSSVPGVVQRENGGDHWPGDDPIGKASNQLQQHGTARIAGVAGESSRAICPTRGAQITRIRAVPWPFLAAVVRTRAPSEPPLRPALGGSTPIRPRAIRTLVIRLQVDRHPRFTALLVGSFAEPALLGCFGSTVWRIGVQMRAVRWDPTWTPVTRWSARWWSAGAAMALAGLASAVARAVTGPRQCVGVSDRSVTFAASSASLITVLPSRPISRSARDTRLSMWPLKPSNHADSLRTFEIRIPRRSPTYVLRRVNVDIKEVNSFDHGPSALASTLLHISGCTQRWSL